MPPLHPAFVHFPIALVAFSFVMDLLGRFMKNSSLRAAAFWSLIAALVTGAIAGITGYWDFTHQPLGDTSKYADFHMDTGLILIGAVILLTAWRWWMRRRESIAGAPYLVLAALVVGLTLFQGWYGGEMVYSQGAGVAAAGKSAEPAINGKERLDKVTRGDR
jgi:uncharacterized membrane protein